MSANPPIKMTSAAVNRVYRLLQATQAGIALRVYIVGGGCSGFQYGFVLDKQANEDDLILSYSIDIPSQETKNIQVWVDCMSMQYLQGAEIDYQENLLGARFVVKNPHAKTTCGCGSSFSIEE